MTFLHACEQFVILIGPDCLSNSAPEETEQDTGKIKKEEGERKRERKSQGRIAVC